jgi:hypothetical protein
MFRSYLHFSSQTLTGLQLENNQIGTKGAQLLTNAFENNKVSFLLVFVAIFLFRQQWLTTLHPGQHEIRDDGSQHLTHPLDKNKVSLHLCFLFRVHLHLFT